jgi:hypothetical protein
MAVGRRIFTGGFAVVLAIGAWGAPSGADTVFSGRAAAAAVRLTMAAANAPGSATPVDAGGPVAQALLDSLGTSQGFAASPFPGDLLLAGPGIYNALRPGPAPEARGYPFAVRSDYPTVTSAGRSDNLTELDASSSPDEARAAAVTGGRSPELALGKLTAEASVVSRSGAVTSEAVGTVDGFVLGPLRIGRVLSKAVAVLSPAGEVMRRSQLDVSGVAIGDAAVGLGPDGFTAEGTSIPLRPGDPLLRALAEHGLEVRWVAEEPVPGGIVAAGLRITRRQDFGPGGAGAVTFLLGQSTAAVTGQAPTAPASTPAAPESPPASTTTTDHAAAGRVGAAGGATEPTAGPLATPPGVGADAGRAVAAAVPATGPSGLGAGSADAAPAPADVSPHRTGRVAITAPLEERVAAPAARRAVAEFGMSRLYPVLVVAGAALLVAARLARTTAIRRPS